MAARTSSSSRRTRVDGDDTVGQFVIDQEIGKGSFAQVYAGRHKVSAHFCAIRGVNCNPLLQLPELYSLPNCLVG